MEDEHKQRMKECIEDARRLLESGYSDKWGVPVALVAITLFKVRTEGLRPK